MTKFHKFAPLLFALIGSAGFDAIPARANLLPYLSSVTSSVTNPGDSTFNYSASLSNDERIDGSGTGNTAYFTMYDFQGYVPGSVVAPTGWTATVQYVGITPVGISVPDDPTVVNMTFTYSGVATIIGTGQTFTGFSADSIYSAINTNAYFSQQSTKNAGPASGGLDAGLGPEDVPMSESPEPATLAFAGAGLALMATRIITRKRS